MVTLTLAHNEAVLAIQSKSTTRLLPRRIFEGAVATNTQVQVVIANGGACCSPIVDAFRG